jgi:prepilin-type N-terminal cleavage/methylation domain-containing protein
MRNGGFTIVEVIIGMAILSVAMLIATLGFTTIVRLQEKAQTAQNIQQNARYIAEAINRDVRSSDNYQLRKDPPQLLLPNSIDDASMVRYTYKNERELYRYTCQQPTFCRSNQNDTEGENLVPEDMRITELEMRKLNKDSGSNTPLQVYITATQRENLDETDPYTYEYDATTIVVPRR